jgi:hypothetical protein
MRIPQDQNKYSYSFRYVELARYVPNLNRVIREKAGDSPILIDINDVHKYANKYNNTGIYTSIWQYSSQNIEEADKMGSLYFDIDNSNVQISLDECKKLYSYLSQYIPEESLIVYYTGKKGFHIECEAIALGINKSNNLHKNFRYIASDLSTKLSLTSLDFSVYDPRRMWRLAGSKHQETGLFKTKLSNQILFSSIDEIIEYSSVPQDNYIKEQEFSHTANEWYREYIYQMEEEKNKPKDILSYFNEHGSKSSKSFDESEKVFDKQKLLKSCSAISRIEKEAIDNKHLDHESRLFLCSILTYTEESVIYLHQILSNCNDYNFEKSSAHINDWIKRREMGIGGRPYTCERANAAGVGCGDCSLESRNKWVKVGTKFVETQEKSSPSPIRFAYSSIKKGGEKDD